MIPTVLASAKLVASYAAVAPAATIAPVAGAVNPTPVPFSAVKAGQTQTDTPKQTAPAVPSKLRIVESGYFDLGYEKLIGTFSDVILHGGVRYGQEDLTAFVRESTLDTRGTGLPYPQAVTGSAVGLELRHWFPKNQMFATVQAGTTLSGPYKNQADYRYGLVGYTNWTHNEWLSDCYGELFYIALANDTYFDLRIRSGRVLTKDKSGNYVWLYLVGQGWLAGRDVSGTENRFEFGPGIAYFYKPLNLSVNVEARGGYSYRGPIPSPTYFNPTIIISSGFDK